MSTEVDTDVSIPRGLVEEKKRAGKCPSRAVRPSERGRFVAQELLKLRRMTLGQIARLCRLSTTYFARELERRGCDAQGAWRLANSYPDDVLARFTRDARANDTAECEAVLSGLAGKGANESFEESAKAPHVQSARDMVRRMVALGLIYRQSATVGLRQRSVFMLTEDGYQQACSSSGVHPNSYRDCIAVEFLAHLLMTTDFYLDFVTAGTRDWGEVRRRAAHFDWFASNARTRFEWAAPARPRPRRVDPDAVIETDTHRFLVEIERSTKALPVVERKFQSYNRLFSKVASSSQVSGYREKFNDEKQPVVVFVFATEERAKNAQGVADRMRARQGIGWQIRDLRIGTVESMARQLRALVFNDKAVSPPPPPLPKAFSSADVALIRRHVSETWRLVEQVQKAAAAAEVLHKPTLPATLGEMNKLAIELSKRSAS